MSARMATAPISTDVATVGDYRSRALLGDRRNPPDDKPGHQQDDEPALAPETPSSVVQPTPGDAAGTAFAAAVVAGGLPPKAQTAQEIYLRAGKAWSPPDSELHLTDRIA
jgi:hypothetical protein